MTKKVSYFIVSLILMSAIMTIFIIQSNKPITGETGIQGTSDKIAAFILSNILGKEIGEHPGEQSIILGLSIYKLGHLFGYLTLGIATFLFTSAAFNLRELEKENISLYINISFIIDFLFSISDEIHQSFIEGRTGSIFDVGLDTIGFTIGIIITAFIYYLIIYNRRKKELRDSIWS